MKFFYCNFFLLIIKITFCLGHVTAQTYSVPVFTLQSQVDSFRISYPNCEVIVGDVILKGSNIVNSDSLLGIKEIKGNLVIDHTFIQTLKGFDNLKVVTDLTISNNDSLEAISPFLELKTIQGNFLLENSPKLLSLSVFPALQKMKKFSINGNTAELKVIEGFEGLVEISNFFIISDNIGICKVSGFNNAYINTIYFRNNKSLQEINGFNGEYNYCQNLNSVVQSGATLSFFKNDSLQRIKGFDGLRCVRAVFVSQNPQLKEVEICNGAEAVGEFTVQNNLTLEKLVAFNEVKRTYVFRRFELSDNSELNDLQIFKKIKNIEYIILRDLKIKSLNGSFGMVDSVYLDGVDGIIEISGNKYLTDISSLENLKYVSKIIIVSNKNLGECSIESICNHIKVGRETIFGINNYPGCRSVNQVLSKCAVGTKDNFTDEININPNPADDYIDIELLDEWQDEQHKLIIYNQMGHIVLTQNITKNIRLDINSLVSGVYCIVLDNINQRFSQRFIKI